MISKTRSLDQIDLVGIQQTLLNLRLPDQLELALTVKLEQILGRPTPAKPVKAKAAKKPSERVTQANGQPKREAEHARMAA